VSPFLLRFFVAATTAWKSGAWRRAPALGYEKTAVGGLIIGVLLCFGGRPRR
jgi:hypothetical protein